MWTEWISAQLNKFTHISLCATPLNWNLCLICNNYRLVINTAKTSLINSVVENKYFRLQCIDLPRSSSTKKIKSCGTYVWKRVIIYKRVSLACTMDLRFYCVLVLVVKSNQLHCNWWFWPDCCFQYELI